MSENSYNRKVVRATLVALLIFSLGAFLAFVIFGLNHVPINEIVEGASNEATPTIVIRTSNPEIDGLDAESESDNQVQRVLNEASVNFDYQMKEIPFDLSQMEIKYEIPFDLSQVE